VSDGQATNSKHLVKVSGINWPGYTPDGLLFFKKKQNVYFQLLIKHFKNRNSKSSKKN